MSILTADDLILFDADLSTEKAEQMIEDAEAIALQLAPCLESADAATLGVARAVLRRAVLRWAEQGSGAFQQQAAGPFSATWDTRSQVSQGIFFPSEVAQLRELCASTRGARARTGWLL